MTLLMFALLTMPSMGCAYKSRDLYVPPTIDASKGKDVRGAIRRALAEYGWVSEKDQAGLITARQTSRSLQARVNIFYTKTAVTIKYVDSVNLNYKNEMGRPTIHATYNRWVTNLAKRITQLLF